MIIFFNLEGRGNDGCDERGNTGLGREKMHSVSTFFLSFFISEDILMGFDYRSFFEYEALLHSSISRAFHHVGNRTGTSNSSHPSYSFDP